MNPAFLPGERLFRFEGSASAPLYRDHLGRAVLADVEGCGRFSIEGAAEVSVDGHPISEASGVFSEHLLVTGRDHAAVWAATGRTEDACLEPVWTDLPVTGPGWVVGIEGKASIDGFALPPDVPFPFPALHGVTGSGRVAWVASSTRAAVVQTVSMADPSSLAAARWQAQNQSVVEPLESLDSEGSPLRVATTSHLNAAEFDVVVPAEARGLVIERLHDQFHGRQRARVMVDGKLAGWWFQPYQDRDRRWAVDRFGIEAELLRPGSVCRIRIDPPAGSPLWSVARYGVIALT